MGGTPDLVHKWRYKGDQLRLVSAPLPGLKVTKYVIELEEHDAMGNPRWVTFEENPTEVLISAVMQLVLRKAGE